LDRERLVAGVHRRVELPDLAVPDGGDQRTPAGLVEVAGLERFLDRERQQARIGWLRGEVCVGRQGCDARAGFQDPERPLERVGRRGVPGCGRPQPRDEALDMATAAA
jgi:hypothetical protein